MKIAVKTIEGGSAGEIELADARVRRRPSARTSCSARGAGSSPRRQQGTHKTKEIARNRRHDQEAVRPEGHRPRPPGHEALAAVPRRRQGLRSGRAQPRLTTCRRRCASSRLSTALSAKAGRRQADRGRDGDARRAPRPRSWQAHFGKLGWARGAGHRRRRGRRPTSRGPRATSPNVDVLPQQGANVYDILRRDTLVLTKDAVKHLEERLK